MTGSVDTFGNAVASGRALLGDMFLPNRNASKKIGMFILAVHALIAMWFWYNNPWKVIPNPQEIGAAWLTLWNRGEILFHFQKSIWTFVQAVFWSAIISFGLGYLSTTSFFRPVGWVVSKLRFWGLVGLTFIFTVMFGAGSNLQVAIITFGLSVFLTPAIMSIVDSIKRVQYDDAMTLSPRMNEWRVLWYVVIRGTLPQALEALRQNSAIGWVMLISVEAIVQSLGGAGALMIRNDKYQKLAFVYAIQFTILFVGILQDLGFVGIRKVLCPHYELSLKRGK